MGICIFSSCGQIVFGFFMLGCLILTAAATFYGDAGRLLSWDCLNDQKKCDPWEKEHLNGMRAMAVFLCLAIAFEIISLAWNFVTFCACCWKEHIIHPLMLLSLLCTLFLIITIIASLVTFGGKIPYYEQQDEQRGLCFWIVVGAVHFSAISLAVSILTVFLGERGM
ncbi:hypothetical protein Aduo_013912 [Ancylostoma duodenale]